MPAAICHMPPCHRFAPVLVCVLLLASAMDIQACAVKPGLGRDDSGHVECVDQERLYRRAEENFRDRLVEALSQADPAAVELRTPSGRQQLDRVIRRARGHGFEFELDIGRFVATAWLLGEDFDTRIPAMREILADPSLSPTQKAELLETLTTSWLDQLHQGRIR